MEKLVLLDSNSLINRAYYALPNLSNHSGQFTGAIFGYLNMLLKLIDKYEPTHIIATFDRKAPTFRKEMYAEYKGTRKPMPEELRSQMQPLKDVLTAMNIPIVELDGYEADDIIGTFAKRFKMKTYIVTGDKDSLQLIDNTTTVLLTRKGITEIDEYTPEKLLSEGLVPSQVIDLKSLMGDSSDNIPGVPGVGEKTARDLLDKYKTLDGVYEHVEEVKGKLKEKLLDNKELAYLSYKLATININSPVDIDLEKAKLTNEYDPKVKEILRGLELNKIVDRLNFKESKEVVKELVDIEKINTLDMLDKLISKIYEKKEFSIFIGGDIEIALSKNEGYTIEVSQDLFGGLFFDDIIKALKPVFEDNTISKLFYDVKTVMHQVERCDVKINKPYDDILIKGYLADANRNYKQFDEMLNTYNVDSILKAASIFVINDMVDKELKDNDLVDLYTDIELPLVEVLFDMELEGFKVDKEKVKSLSQTFSYELEDLTKNIIELAGEDFNINSPKQLGVILFEKLGLKGGKKTKTGYSTNVDVLQSLEGIHPIIEYLLRYREVAKLKSTYLDGILPLMDGKDKLHTIFKQTVTATGRLSSTEPNIQNIPVRKPEGKLIRGMFIASENKKLVCADYSQIELRLMAAFSGDDTMINAFNNNIDIHATTASKIFNIPLEEVTSDIRRQAKAVNFGIIYGISDYGLAKDLSIGVYKAKEFINNYFMTYPLVKEYMDNLIKVAKEKGYAETMMGRKRQITELYSSNYNIRSFGERVAMNMPLQGSASDIIKKAMITVARKLKENNLKAKLIMQVHDELIIDTPLDEVEIVSNILKSSMENVVRLDVKLEAEVGVGDNWLDAK